MSEEYIQAYQDKNWYEKNKNNFESSLPIKSNHPLYFLPNDLTRFGHIIPKKIGANTLYLLKLPRGLKVYHSSRSLFLTQSLYPIPGYSQELTPEENKQNILKRNEECLSQIKGLSECIVNTYYSAPPQDEYLHKDTNKNFLGSQIRYAYGIDTETARLEGSQAKKEYELNYIDPIFNDRNALEADNHKIGVASFRLKKDTLFLLYQDDFLINRGKLGLHNVRVLYEKFKQTYPSPEDLEAFSSAAGVYLKDNILYHIHKYSTQNGKDIIEWFSNEFKKLFSLMDKITLNSLPREARESFSGLPEKLALNPTIGYISDIYKASKKFKTIPEFITAVINGKGKISELPGLRMSTFESDRPFHNFIYKFFSTEGLNVQGYIGANLYNIRFDPFIKIMNNALVPTLVSGLFHTELMAFYAPDVLTRDQKDFNDGNYRLGKIMNEMRKYKTTNILNEKNQNFHQGHLYEHSSWVALNAVDIANKYHHPSLSMKPDVYLIGGYLHDVGKSGLCEDRYETSYKNLNPHQAPKTFYCKKVNYLWDNKTTQVGFEYYDIPNHPEVGYRMLKGLNPYQFYTFINGQVEKGQTFYSYDWEKILSNLTGPEIAAIRIGTACHWDYGPLASSFSKENLEKYLRKIELYYNAEFPIDKRSPQVFLKIVHYVIMISIADILGATFRNMDISDGYKIYNEIPNYPWIWKELWNTTIKLRTPSKTNFKELDDIYQNPEKVYDYYRTNPKIKELYDKVMDVNNMNKMAELSINIAEDISKGKTPVKLAALMVESFPKIWKDIITTVEGGFKFNPKNSYNVLNVIMDGFVDLIDVYTSFYDYFPKVVIFDLDSTLFNLSEMWSNGQYHFFNDTKFIIDLLQKLRPPPPIGAGIKVAIASRHYIPARLIKELKNPNSPLFWKNFDLIYSIFTGDVKDINDYCESLGDKKQECLRLQNVCEDTNFKNWCMPNDYKTVGFIVGNENDKTVFYHPPTVNSKKSKATHIDFIQNYFKVKPEDMILFDDDNFYMEGENPEGLEGRKVYTAGVDENTGLTYDVFNQAMRLFTFASFKEAKHCAV